MNMITFSKFSNITIRSSCSNSSGLTCMDRCSMEHQVFQQLAIVCKRFSVNSCPKLATPLPPLNSIPAQTFLRNYLQSYILKYLLDLIQLFLYYFLQKNYQMLFLFQEFCGCTTNYLFCKFFTFNFRVNSSFISSKKWFFYTKCIIIYRTSYYNFNK